MEDREIVDLYLARDEAAIGLTAERYGRRLRALSMGIVGDIQSAEECENDTYMAAWNSIPPNEPREYFYMYLARLTRHISIDLCRSRSRLKRSGLLCELSAEMEQCIPSPDDCAQRIDDLLLSEAINGFLKTLNEEKRNIFLRRYWYIDSVENISKRFGITESKVKTTLFRCRRQLREYLEKEGFHL